jgi:hypothetical protein
VLDSSKKEDNTMAPKKGKVAGRKPKVKAKWKGKDVAKKKAVGKQSAERNKNRKKRVRGKADAVELVTYQRRGLGPRSGGQSGDTQGISGAVETDSESVEELLEEGQSFEAEVLSGVEHAPDADVAEVQTKEVPEDDVPDEYRNRE